MNELEMINNTWYDYHIHQQDSEQCFKVGGNTIKLHELNKRLISIKEDKVHDSEINRWWVV